MPSLCRDPRRFASQAGAARSEPGANGARMKTERRRRSRTRQRMPAEILHCGERTRGFLVDVSPDGAFVQMESPLPVGEEAELWFASDGLAPQVARVRVVRRRSLPAAAAAVGRSGMGVAWIVAPPFVRELDFDESLAIEVEIDGASDAGGAPSASVPPAPLASPAAPPFSLEPAGSREPSRDSLHAAPTAAAEALGEIVPVDMPAIIERTTVLGPALVRADVVVIDEGELGGFEELLRALGAATLRMRWGAQAEPFAWEAPPRIVIVSARVALAVPLSDAVLGAGAFGIAVCDSDASTLRAQLRRQGYDLVVQRAAHPATLRLLLASLLFQKRERRAARRRAFGAPIRFWRGFRRTQAVLLELSPKNASLLLAGPLALGTRLTIRIPAAHAGGRRLSLPASVARSVPADDGTLVGLRFGALSARKLARLEALVKQLDSTGPIAQPSGRHAGLFALAGRPRGERRRGRRIALSQQALALDERTGVARDVLFGSDLSLGGMRIEPHPRLARGALVRLALQPPGGAPPVLLEAEVARDDGERGLVLRFVGVSPTTRLALERMLDAAADVERTRRARAAREERIVLGTLFEAGEAAR